jgi:hypothetical protein
MPTNTEYWRAAVVVVVTNATDQLVASARWRNGCLTMSAWKPSMPRLSVMTLLSCATSNTIAPTISKRTAILAPTTRRLCIPDV